MAEIEDIPKEIKEAFAYAEKWNAEADEDLKNGKYASAVHKYKAIAHKFIDQYKTAPSEYMDCLSLSIKSMLGQMDLIISKTSGQKKKQKTLGDIIIIKKIRDDIRRFLGKVKSSPYSQVSVEDTTMLLYGPSGTGKTYLAEAIANEFGTSCLTVNCGDINQKFRGEGEKMLTSVFKKAEEANCCILFDEIHMLFAFKDGEESTGENGFVLQQFLTEMNNRSRGCLVIGTTSRPWIMSETVRRRFEKHIYIPLPGQAHRKAVLKYLISNCGMASALQPEHIDEYATRMKGYSPDDMNKVIKSTAEYGEECNQKAKYFKRVSCSGKELYIPCKAHHSGAENLSMKNCPGIVVSVLTVPLMERALAYFIPNKISENEIRKFDDFATKKS